jgi:hypothetical protein
MSTIKFFGSLSLLCILVFTSQSHAAEASQPTGSEPSASTAEISEKKEWAPEFVYRAGGLKRRRNSVFFSSKRDSDYIDQLHLALNFTRSWDWSHFVTLVPAIRTPRTRPADDNVELVIEQAWLQFGLGDAFAVTAGKKAENEGSGFIVNPSDLLNEDKDIFDFLYQREGKVFTRLSARISPTTSVSIGLIPKRGREADEGRLWLQAGTEVLESDLRFQYTQHSIDRGTAGLSLSSFVNDSIELHFDGRWQARQRSVEGASTASPEAFSAYKQEDSSVFLLAGSRIVLSPKRTLILEAIQNQSGLLPEEMQRYFLELRTRAEQGNEAPEPNTKLIGRRYGFISWQDEDTFQRLKLAFSTLYNGNDRSAFVLAQIRWFLSPITSVEIAPSFYVGQTLSEFGEMPFSRAVYFIFRGRF